MTKRYELPIACRLSGVEIKGRQELLSSLFEGVRRVEELEDGYTFAFPGSAEWSRKLAEVVAAERACCPFLTFALLFEPENGPISLRVTGPEGAKEFVEAELMASGNSAAAQ